MRAQTEYDVGLAPELVSVERAADILQKSAHSTRQLALRGMIESEKRGRNTYLKLDSVLTYYDGSRYYHLNVELSVDGQTWKKVIEFTDTIPATIGGYSGTFPRTDARYVRINMLKNSANRWVHIVEVIANEAK